MGVVLLIMGIFGGVLLLFVYGVFVEFIGNV